MRRVIKGPFLPSEVKKKSAYLFQKTLRESADSQPAPPNAPSLSFSFLPSVERLKAERALSVPPPLFLKYSPFMCV